MVKLFDTGLTCEDGEDYVLVYFDGFVIRYSKTDWVDEYKGTCDSEGDQNIRITTL